MDRARTLFFLAMFTLPATASAQEPASRPAPFPGVGKGSFCRGAWTDGEDLLIHTCSRHISRAERGEADTAPLGSLGDRVTALAGRVASGKLTLAAAGEEGHAGLLLDGKWVVGRAPDTEEDLVAVALGANNEVWLAGQEKALYRWQGVTWRRFPYPAGTPKIKHMIHLPGGALLLGGERGLLLRFSSGAFNAFRAANLSSGELGDIAGLWRSARSGLLYILGRRSRLAVVSLSGAPAATATHGFGDTWVNAMAGGVTPGGDLLVVDGTEGQTAFFKGKLYPLPQKRDVSFPGQMVLNRKDRKIYVAAQNGLIGIAAGQLFSPARRAALEQKAETAAKQEEDRKVSFGFSRFFLTSASVAMGPSIFLPDGLDSDSSFTLDLELGLRTPFAVIHDSMLMLWPVIGYSYDASDLVGGHRMVAGLGINAWLLNGKLSLSAMSRFVMGSVAGADGLTLGTRNGLRIEAILGLLAVDVSHQMFFLDGGRTNEVRVTIGTDIMMWLRVIWFIRGIQWMDTWGKGGGNPFTSPLSPFRRF